MGRERRSPDPTTWISRGLQSYRARHDNPFRPGPEFFRHADPVVQTKRTLLGYDRLYVLWQAVRNVATVRGGVVEIGAYRGGSAHFLASAFDTMDAQVSLHVIDTFSGHPADAIGRQDPDHVPGQFRKTSFEDVRAYLAVFPQVAVHAGDALALVPALPESEYRLVHIDTDLYQPTYVCLEYFGQRLAPNGIVVVDDYGASRCAGVTEAASEYLAKEKGRFQVWDQRTEQLVLVRR